MDHRATEIERGAENASGYAERALTRRATVHVVGRGIVNGWRDADRVEVPNHFRVRPRIPAWLWVRLTIAVDKVDCCRCRHRDARDDNPRDQRAAGALVNLDVDREHLTVGINDNEIVARRRCVVSKVRVVGQPNGDRDLSGVRADDPSWINRNKPSKRVGFLPASIE